MEDNILHDFSNEQLKVSIYDGAAEKRTMYYQGHRYMLKFGYLLDSSKRETSRTSYINIPVNEFIGSRIFKTAGLPTQDVLLGTYRGQSVVACRDFMEELNPSWKLIHFKQLEISMPGESGKSKARPDWEYVKHVLDDSQDIESIRSETKHRFCQMICVDALIGNYDRHSNNWGFIADGQANIRGLAPVYDCGSSLMPHLSHDEMLSRLKDPKLMKQANIDSPTLAMNVHGKRRKYSFFMTSTYASEFRKELPSIWDKISEERINPIKLRWMQEDDTFLPRLWKWLWMRETYLSLPQKTDRPCRNRPSKTMDNPMKCRFFRIRTRELIPTESIQ